MPERRDDSPAQACHAGIMAETIPAATAPHDNASANPKTRRRVPRKATPRHLENAALWYLARFQATARSLERMLMRRVFRSARHHGTDPEVGRLFVGELIARYRRAQLLDDAAYAQARVRTLHDRGLSARAIRARLMEKGVGEADMEAAFAALSAALGEDQDLDMDAARRYARRRRLGPWRGRDQREARHDKDLAALARAGFSYSVAKTVIDGEA